MATLLRLRDMVGTRSWILIPAAMFVIGQLVSLAFLQAEKPRQEAIPAGDGYQYFVREHAADPPWADYVTGWNGQAYREIATNGYPVPPPRTEDGTVLPNPWAFFPLYPVTVKGVMVLTGLEFGYAASLTSLAFGLGSVILLYRLIHRFSGARWPATLAVASLLVWPSAPLFQLAYTESMALFFLISSLSLIHHRRYEWAALPILLLGLTRPLGPPDLALLLLHGLYIGRGYLWPLRKLPTGIGLFLRSREGYSMVALMMASVVATAAWPAISYLASGESAFIEARASYGGEGFFLSWFRDGFVVSDAYPATPAIVAVLFGLLAILQMRNKNIPDVLRIWPAVLLIYILMFTSPVGNEVRYLMLGCFAFPVLDIPKNRLLQFVYFFIVGATLAFMLYLQWSWVHFHWVSEAGFLRKNV